MFLRTRLVIFIATLFVPSNVFGTLNCTNSSSNAESYEPKLIAATVIGYGAGTIGIIWNLPQVYKIYKDKDTTGLSLKSQLLSLLLNSMWLTYGILANNVVITATSAPSALIQIVAAIGVVLYEKTTTVETIP